MALWRLFVILFQQTTLKVLAFDAAHYPFPYPDGVTPCDSDNPPEIISFHGHIVFDGANKTKAQSAVNARQAFADYISSINPKFGDYCSFGRANPAPSMKDICVFPPLYNFTMAGFPFPVNDVIFTTTNYDFFIPKDHYLTAEMWFRQHIDPALVSYMFHTNTGCQDNSHTIWSMVNEGYPFQIVTEGLLCCHSGPAGCLCNLVSFTLSDGQCLGGNLDDDDSVLFGDCDSNTMTSMWRETHYNETFIQIDLLTTGGDADKLMCLGQDAKSGKGICKKGSKIKLVPCYERDNRLNLFNWVDGKIMATGCGKERDLCITMKGKEMVLEECAQSIAIKRKEL